MNRLVFTPLAESDLREILDYIAKHRPLTAIAVVSRIREKCNLLVSHPQIGQLRPEFPGELRSLPVERWVIFYRVVDNALEIYRVLDGSRDIDSLLG